MMWSAYADLSIYLDSNIIIYSVEENDAFSRVTNSLLQAIDTKVLRAVTSELAIAEVLVGPLALEKSVLVQKYNDFLAVDSIVDVVAIDRNVLALSASLRITAKLKLFDAIHVATARIAGCDYFLTQDERLGRAIADRPKWLKLSELS